MLKKLAAVTLLSMIVPYNLMAAVPSGRQECSAWSGRYEGSFSSVQNVIGQKVKSILVVMPKEVYLSLQGNVLPGAFEASSTKATCTRDKFSTVLDDGFGGMGKITMRKMGGKTYLKIYGFTTGSGPNKQGFLPSRPTEVEVKASK